MPNVEPEPQNPPLLSPETRKPKSPTKPSRRIQLFNTETPGRGGKTWERQSGTPLVAALTNAIARMDSAGKVRESLALAYWPRAVGEMSAAASEPETVRDGILFVRTKSSVWSHELSLHKTRILLNLNRMLGGKIITDIIFRAQGLTPTEEIPEAVIPSAEELAPVLLDPAEKTELRSHLNALITLEDDKIRSAIAKRLVQEAKLYHWKIEQGWKPCTRCKAAHKTDYDLCPVCRLCR